MARITPFSVGQRWYCNRGEKESFTFPNFWFVVLGPGKIARTNEPRGSKLCLMEVDWRRWADSADDFAKRYGSRSQSLDVTLGTYSTQHLRHYAVQEPLNATELAASRQSCKKILAKIEPLLTLSIKNQELAYDGRAVGEEAQALADKSRRMFKLAETLASANPNVEPRDLPLVAEAERFALSREVARTGDATAGATVGGSPGESAEASPATARRMRI